MAGAIGVSLAVAATGAGTAATFHAKPARSAHATETATQAYGIGAAPDSGSDQLIAYAPDDSYTYVAWNAPGSGNQGIDLCIIVPDTTSCSGGAPVLLTDKAAFSGGNANFQPTLSNLQVLANGDVVVTGSSAAGSTNSAATTEAWESPEGGSAFLSAGQGLTNSGGNITPVYTYYAENDSAPLSGNDLAIADAYAGYLSDSPVSGSESPGSLSSPNLDTNGDFSRKSLEVSGDELAAEPDPAASGKYVVVSAGDDFSGTAPSGCPSPSLATGYGVAVGSVGGTGAGSLNAQTSQKTYSLLQCQAESPALASPVGGSQGIGVLEEEGAEASYPSSSDTLSVVWRPFNPTATGGSFGSAVTLQDISNYNIAGGSDFDAVEDTGDGVYASWIDEQGLVLDYSANGGATWAGPIAQNSPSPGATQGDPTIAAVGGGIGEVAYDNNDEVYVQTVDFEPPAPTTLTTVQTAGTLSAANLSVDAGTAGISDQATLTGTNVKLDSIGYVGGAFPGGAVTYSLYTNSACTSKTKVYTEGTENVTAGVVPPSSAVSAALKPGTYYWQASFAGNLANAASTSACGGEKLTVAPVQTTGSGSASGASASFTLRCLAACSGTAKLATLTGGTARAGQKSAKSGVLGKASFKLTKAGKVLVEVPLTKFGQKLLKRDHDKLTATLLLKTRADRKSYSTTSKLKLHR